MTVRDWITREATGAPRRLLDEIVDALGPDADRDASRTGEVCLAAATRALDALVSSRRFKREDALALLTIDALTTFAYEHASQSTGDAAVVEQLVERGTHMLGQLMTQRV